MDKGPGAIAQEWNVMLCQTYRTVGVALTSVGVKHFRGVFSAIYVVPAV